jgi:cyanophycinase-like exopeptidase
MRTAQRNPRRRIYETDVRRSEEQILLKMVIYPNAIVDHHFDELNFLSRLVCCLFSLLPITMAFTLRL